MDDSNSDAHYKLQELRSYVKKDKKLVFSMLQYALILMYLELLTSTLANLQLGYMSSFIFLCFGHSQGSCADVNQL
jgi:hypothetical protein